MNDNQPSRVIRQAGGRRQKAGHGSVVSPTLSGASIDLTIQELVLHGFSSRDRDRIGAALQQELTRLFAEQGMPRSLTHSRAIPQVDAGSIETTASATSEFIGIQIAQAVYRGMNQ